MMIAALVVGTLIAERPDYPERTTPLESLGLACDAAVARERAMRYARRARPRLAGQLEDAGFTQFRALYRGETAHPSRVFELTAILEYRPRGHAPGSHFESSLTVTMDRECNPLDATHFSGDVVVHY